MALSDDSGDGGVDVKIVLLGDSGMLFFPLSLLCALSLFFTALPL